jgi:hypothetical protein
VLVANPGVAKPVVADNSRVHGHMASEWTPNLARSLTVVGESDDLL